MFKKIYAVCPAYTVAEIAPLTPGKKLIMRLLIVPDQYLIIDSTGQGENERLVWLPSVKTEDPECLSPFPAERILIKCYWILNMHYCGIN